MTPAVLPLIAAYDRAAPRWSGLAHRLGFPDAYRWLIVRAMQDRPAPRRILDVGCGTGTFAGACLDALPPSRDRILAIADPAPAMLQRAHARLAASAKLVTLTCTLRDLPARPPQDLILCAHVLEHGSDPARDLAHLATILAPGGLILLVHSRPHWCQRLVALRWHHHPRAPAAIRTAIHDAGLRLIADHRFPAGPPRRLSHAYLISKGETP